MWPVFSLLCTDFRENCKAFILLYLTSWEQVWLHRKKKKIWIGSTETGLNIFKKVLSCYLVGVSLVLKKAFQGFVFSAIAFEFLWLLMFCANQSWSWIYLFKILGFQDWRIIHKPKILYFSAAFLFFFFFNCLAMSWGYMQQF